MRVTGGILRGRLVKVPKGDAVRPTQDMVRQALFSSLAVRIPGASFLDLFAGSGAVGLEAWSRGAARIDWVESDSRVFLVLQDNLKTLCGGPAAAGKTADQEWRAVRSDVFTFLKKLPGVPAYDIVFADPPYDRLGVDQWAVRLLNALAMGGLLADDGFFVMEQSREEPEARHFAWDVTTVKVYGGTRLTLYRKRGHQ
ncbi:MAG: 16S rRNA (guanine(966)-N(2))-methyltransferase RsmD [bacterium]